MSNPTTYRDAADGSIRDAVTHSCVHFYTFTDFSVFPNDKRIRLGFQYPVTCAHCLDDIGYKVFG